jgi:MFS family permease
MGAATTDQAGVTPTALPDSSRTTIVAILLSVFLMGAGMGVQGSAVSLRGGLEGFLDSTVGLIMSANYVGLIIGSLIAPSLVRNVGYVRTFAASASLGSASA